jgi:hypothetical protein
MKAISLWQPWASLWLTTAKVHETRHWKTNHRGYLLVHAAKRPIDKDLPLDLLRICWEHFPSLQLPLGCLIGRVELIDCISTADFIPDNCDRICGDFSAGRFGWKREWFARFEKPIPYKGRQGIFDIPDKFFLDLMP